MTLYRTRARKERLKELIGSLRERQNIGKRTMYMIDSSVKYKEMHKWGDAQRSIFGQTVNELIEKQRICMKQEQLEEQAEEFRILQKKLGNYIKHPEQYKLLKLENGRKLKKYVSCQEHNMKKIYIERKYNTKLAYQIQHILQAKNIEDQKIKNKEAVLQRQESPLIRNIIKITRGERKSDKGSYSYRKEQENRHVELSFGVDECKSSLRKSQLRDAMEAKDREYVSPVMTDPKAQLQKYSSNVHLSTLLGSSRRR